MKGIPQWQCIQARDKGGGKMTKCLGTMLSSKVDRAGTPVVWAG